MQPLNSPLELGVRALVLLTAAFPRSLDLDRLVLMDHCLLHSADLGGPPSLLPEAPLRSGELGLKRSVLDHGVRLMARAGMIEVETEPLGIAYKASEEARPFLNLVTSPMMDALTEVSRWVIYELGDLTSAEIRERMRFTTEHWSEDIAPPVPGERGEY